MADPPRRSISSDTSAEEISPALLGAIQHIVLAAIREQKGLQEVRCQIGGAPEDERQGIPFTEIVMADELPVNCRTPAITEYDGTTGPLEHLARFENAALLHRKMYTPLMVPITQALMAVEGKWLLARPRSWKEGPQRPQSDKFCHFHNDYGHTTEDYRHLKNEIERRIQNGYLQEYVCWEKARGIGPYQKKETDRSKEAKVANPEASPRGGPKMGTNEKTDPNDPPRKGVIRMITGDPIGETAEDAPIIQFGRAEHSGSKSAHNDALVITALLANYEVGRIFIDSGSSADILFEDAFDQMQLEDISLEEEELEKYRETPSNREDVMQKLYERDNKEVQMKPPRRPLLVRKGEKTTPRETWRLIGGTP
ncbi:UNVERIFIED_CONTAM: hypothetical protein Slati_3954200 [Sesamum latifolium]|uniref:Uncharacterized protein n=1 Tax=Sesamum latifolium TaxID=2727402 RepID=A0AAW2TPH4_9LAMI